MVKCTFGEFCCFNLVVTVWSSGENDVLFIIGIQYFFQFQSAYGSWIDSEMAAPPKLNEFHIHPQNILFRSSVIRIRARNWKNDVKYILLDISDPGSSKMTGTNLDNFILLSNFVTKRWRGNIVEGPGSAEVIYKLYQSKNLSSKWWQKSQKSRIGNSIWFKLIIFE